MTKPIIVEDEPEEVFDRSWLYGTRESPDKRKAEKLLDNIINLNKIKGLRIIITLKSVEFYKEIKNRLEKIHDDLIGVLREPIVLSDFIEEDLSKFYKKNMEYFFGNINYFDYFKDFSDSYYPLNDSMLKYIYNKSKGNPRDIIKLLINIFNEIILSNDDLEDILEVYQ